MPSRHPRRPARTAATVAVVAVSAAWVLSQRASAAPGDAAATAGLPTSAASPSPSLPGDDEIPVPMYPVLAGLPGLGPSTAAAVPASADQVVLASGEGRDSSTSAVRLFDRVPGGWQAAGPVWPAHNALRGWTDHHHADDLHTPIGVFGLSDAGGLLPDPGTRLPYTRSADFAVGGTGFEDEPLAGAFDYVIAIDYNRRPGTSPLDATTPSGPDAGVGIWLHVDHGGPTHGCVSLPREDIRELLLELDPSQHPVVVMGDEASLAR